MALGPYQISKGYDPGGMQAGMGLSAIVKVGDPVLGVPACDPGGMMQM
jgi:hypothetical protein